MDSYIDIVFDGPPGPEAGRFVEVENPMRASISVGEWVHRDDGYWVLRLRLQCQDLQRRSGAKRERERNEKII